MITRVLSHKPAFFKSCIYSLRQIICVAVGVVKRLSLSLPANFLGLGSQRIHYREGEVSQMAISKVGHDKMITN